MRVKGWYLTPWRLKFIYKQNLDIAYSIGRFEEQWAVKENVPYWQYITMNDERVRPAHAALHGKVFRSTDPIWRIIYPPSDWSCRCVVRNFTKKESRRLKLNVESSKGRIGKKNIEVGRGESKQTIEVNTFDGHIIGKGFKNPIGELLKND
jgi:SPP1 gp7 family putative phage head morphogenesis protein